MALRLLRWLTSYLKLLQDKTQSQQSNEWNNYFVIPKYPPDDSGVGEMLDDRLLKLVQYCFVFWGNDPKNCLKSFVHQFLYIILSDTDGIMCSLSYDLAWLGFYPEILLSVLILVPIVCLHLLLWSEEYKGYRVSFLYQLKYNFTYLSILHVSCDSLTEIFHTGKELNHMTVHLLSPVIQHSACHLAYNAVLARAPPPKHRLNSLLAGKLRRNGSQRGED